MIVITKKSPTMWSGIFSLSGVYKLIGVSQRSQSMECFPNMGRDVLRNLVSLLCVDIHALHIAYDNANGSVFA